MVLEFKDIDGQTDMAIHIGLGFKPPIPRRKQIFENNLRYPPPAQINDLVFSSIFVFCADTL